MFQKTILFLGIIFGFCTWRLTANFDQSASLLMPLNQLESTIKNLAESAMYNQGDVKGFQIISDWDLRMNRFKKHINVLKADPTFQPIMQELGKHGFERGYPHDHALILNILGLKPITHGFVASVQDLIPKVHKLIDNGTLIDMKYEDNHILTTRPTIPFSLIFNDYYNSGYWTVDKSNAFALFKDLDTKHNQSQIILDTCPLKGGFPSSQTMNSENGVALLLGLQPNARAVKFYTEQYLQVFHLYLNLISAVQLSKNEQKIWEFSFANSKENSLQWYGRENEYWMLPENRLHIEGSTVKIIEGVTFFQVYRNYPINFTAFNNKQARLTPTNVFQKQGDISREALTFVGNIKNYRLSLYTGTRAYNDYSHYVQVLGFLLEFFFREAFGDLVYLQILYNKITLEIKELADYIGQSIEWSDGGIGKQRENPDKQGLAQPQLFKTWQEFYDARTGNNKDNLTDEQKNSFPPLKETFKQFLIKIFGPDTWTWGDADFSFHFDDTKKDLILKRFLEHAEPQKDSLSGKLNILKAQLSGLQKKLVLLKKQLKKLKKKLG